MVARINLLKGMTSAQFRHVILRNKADLRRAHIEGTSTEQQKGFTLIELSIVLVIIGLIVAGILTGQDLILAARIRSTTSQYMSFNTAVNSFSNKYNYLPGDIPSSTAEAFGFTYIPGGNATQGDGDGYIGSTASLATAEGIMFWADLYQANLIPNALTQIPAGLWGLTDVSATSIPTVFPVTTLGGGNYFWAGTFTDGFNYYGIGPLASFPASSAPAGPVMTAAQGLSAIMAYDIDVKIDDGVPNTGIVQSIDSSTGGVASFVEGGAANSCLNAANTGAYSGGTAGESKLPACQLRLRFN